MSRETGKVNKFDEAILELKLVGGNSIECAVDTGFNGALFLPLDFIEKNNLEIGVREVLQAAEDQLFEVDTANASFFWLGGEQKIPIYISQTGESLIGTEMLADAVLEIDFKNRTVKITKT